MLKELAAAAASLVQAPKLRALRAFYVQCSYLTPAGVALCANGRHPLLLPATKALPEVPRKAPLCSYPPLLGGFNFGRDEGARLREILRRGDGMCLYYSLLKMNDAGLSNRLRKVINSFIISEIRTAFGTTAVLGAIQTEFGRSQIVLDYTDFMSQQTAWGGAIEIALLSRSLCRACGAYR